MAGHNRVDLGRLAAITSAPDIRRATAREVHDLTGFAIGGVPPIGLRGPVRVIMDPDLGRYQVVWAAAGLSTTVFAVPPGTLRILANATVAPIAEERTAADREAAARDRGGALAPGVTAEPRNATITYPGGLRARWRWGGSGSAADVFALSEVGGSLVDLGPTVSSDPDALCRAELRVEGPRGAWTVRFASLISDDPRALHWDTAGLLVVGLRLPHLRPRDGDGRGRAGTTARRRRCSRCSGRPGSSTSSSPPSSRPSPSKPTGPSPGGSPTRTS